MSERVPMQVAELALKIAAAVKEIEKDQEGPYVLGVTFGWEGEPLPARLVPDEFGGMELEVGATHPATADKGEHAPNEEERS